MEHSLNIALIEPQIPQNTGNIARTCAATGAKLHLVGPMGFKIDDRKLKRAGLDYWHLLDISFYDSSDEFFEKHKGETFFYFSNMLPFQFNHHHVSPKEIPRIFQFQSQRKSSVHLPSLY